MLLELSQRVQVPLGSERGSAFEWDALMAVVTFKLWYARPMLISLFLQSPGSIVWADCPWQGLGALVIALGFLKPGFP